MFHLLNVRHVLYILSNIFECLEEAEERRSRVASMPKLGGRRKT